LTAEASEDGRSGTGGGEVVDVPVEAVDVAVDAAVVGAGIAAGDERRGQSESIRDPGSARVSSCEGDNAR
jgi:hypothetical protein